MIHVAILSLIRRWNFRGGVSIREIGRRTGLLHNTNKKYLSNAVVKPRYPKRRNPIKLDAYAAKLVGWLKAASTRGASSAAVSSKFMLTRCSWGFPDSMARWWLCSKVRQ